MAYINIFHSVKRTHHYLHHYITLHYLHHYITLLTLLHYITCIITLHYLHHYITLHYITSQCQFSFRVHEMFDWLVSSNCVCRTEDSCYTYQCKKPLMQIKKKTHVFEKKIKQKVSFFPYIYLICYYS